MAPGGQAFRDADQAVRAVLQYDRARHPFQIILGDEPVPLLRRAPHLPRALAEVVDCAVRKDPGRRFQSAAAFASALRAAARACGNAL